MEYRYNKLNTYLKNKYGEKVLKICIDGDFTCPNRDGSKGRDGCIFCSQKGSGDHLKKMSIKEQVEYWLNYKKDRANKFIVYFQNYTNTYDSVQNLKMKYEQALISDKIVCLAIATRPDCINEKICKLLASFKEKIDVWVELGFQTSNEKIGKLINRCYTNEDFVVAVKLLNKYGIDVITHIMIGLPSEKHEDIVNTVNFLNSQNIQGLKIHSTYVVANTKLNDMYNNMQYEPIVLENYIEEACFVITNINSKVIIHKITGDSPKEILIAPEWNSHKKLIMNGIDNFLRKNNLHQGMYFEKKDL